MFTKRKLISSSDDAAKNWKKEKILGVGGFGEVQLWRNTKNNEPIAIKIMSRNTDHKKELAKISERWKAEYEMMNDLKSDYIVKGIKITDENFVHFMNNNFSYKGAFPVVFMEFCNAGDLREVLRSSENMNGLPECEIRAIIKCLRHAIEYLHDKCKIQHRDLKPENILINQKDGVRSYKLTDLGLARKNETDKTQIQSQVGTKFYFAPEILEGKYSKTVDYWSFGIMTFEIICGVLPFIPHQSIPKVIENLMKKPRTCIAITEKPSTNEYVQHEKLFRENRTSRVFQSLIVPWLQMALDFNRSQRGSFENRNIFTEADRILEKKVLTTFCLNNLQFYDYDLSLYNTMEDLEKAFIEDLKVKPDIMVPLNHPLRQPNATTRPIDFYNEQWKDSWKDSFNNKEDPAMLYLILPLPETGTSTPSRFRFEYRDYNILSNTIKDCLQKSREELGKLPYWYIQEFANHTHFLLANEQRRLKAAICCLRDFALRWEDNVSNGSRVTDAICDDCLFMAGKTEQYCLLHPEESEETAKLKEKFEVLKTIRWKLKERHASVFKIFKNEAYAKIYETKIQEDAFNLRSYRNHLNIGYKDEPKTKIEICEHIKKAVLECTNIKTKLYAEELDRHANNLMDGFKLFIQHKGVKDTAIRLLKELNSQLEYLSRRSIQINSLSKESYPNILGNGVGENAEQLQNSLLETLARMQLDMTMEKSLPAPVNEFRAD